MIRSIRASEIGMAQLELYLNGDKSTLTDDDACILTMVPTPQEWVPWNTFHARYAEAGVTIKDITATVRSLRERHLLQIFEAISDSTYLYCHVGQWRFVMQWTVFRKQLKCANESARNILLTSIANDLYDHNESNVPGEPPLKVSLQ